MRHHDAYGLDVDTAMDLCTLLGMTASGLVAGGFTLAPVMLLAWVAYLSLYTLGGTFLSFQVRVFAGLEDRLRAKGGVEW